MGQNTENCVPNFLNLLHIILTYHTTLSKVFTKKTLVDRTEMNAGIRHHRIQQIFIKY